MKKVLLLLLLISSLSFSRALIKDDVLILNLKEGIIVKINEAKTGELRIKAIKTSDIIIPKNEFFIEKGDSRRLVRTFNEYYEVGDYYIKDFEDGFSVYGKDYSLYYSSKFSNNRRKFQEFKKTWNKEAFHGMGEGGSQNSIKNIKMSIRQVSGFGDQAYLYVPFHFTNRGDAFYYNTNNNDTFKFGKKDKAELTYYPEEDFIDYYFYHQEDMKKLVSYFYNFSDSKSFLPKWAFTYIQSKYGYENEKEVYDLVAEFKKRDIPVGAIVLDLDWFKHMGDLDWDKESWPNYEKLDQYLEENNIKLISISEPFFTVDSKNYDEFEKEGILGQDKNGKTLTWTDWWCFDSDYGAIANPIAPNAKKVWGQKYIDMKNKGIDGYWTDLGEPESTPRDVKFNQYTENEFHNYYNREWSKMIYEVHNEAFPDTRLFNMTRSGYTGSAKYNVSIWSGDSSSSIKALKKQIGIALNAGVSGFSYWGSDVGGFAGQPDKELFIRWMQFGSFTPIFRAHGAKSSREPWRHDKESTDIIKKYIKLRYDLLPYIYSTAFETYEDGLPMMRGLYLENSGDKESSDRKYEFYFGEYILVSPVVERLSKHKDLEVYLPGGNWYDFYTYKKYSSGKHIIDLNIETIPTFIEEGAIIPFESAIKLFPKKNDKTSFELYNDDGVSNNYLKGDYEKIKIILNNTQIEFNNVKNPRIVTINLLKENVEMLNIKKYQEDENFYIFDLKLNEGDNLFKF